MTFKNPSGVHQLSASAPGVGTVTLVAGPASAGRRTFDEAVGTGNTCFYGIEAMSGSDGSEWGIGTVTTAAGVTTLTRNTVIENTNGTTSKINFTSLVHVWVDVPGIRDVFINAAGDTVELPSNVAISFSGTGAASTRTNLGAAGGGNILINGDGRIDQRGSGVAQTTADDAYGSSDRWYSLTQTGTITVQRLVDGADGIPYYQQLKQTQASAQRMGRAQIVSSADSRKFRGGNITLSGKIRCSSAQAIRYAILSWSGTADAVTSDVVSSWTNGSFTAGGFFNSTTLAVVGVGSITPSAATWTDITALTGAVPSACNNLIVMIWTEGTAAQNVTLDFISKLETGSIATLDIPRPFGVEEDLCLKFFRRIGGSAYAYFCAGLADATSTFDGLLLFGTMARIPTVSASGAGDFQVFRAGPAASTCTALSFTNAYLNGTRVAATVSGTPHTVGDALTLRLGASAGYIDVSAEL